MEHADSHKNSADLKDPGVDVEFDLVENASTSPHRGYQLQPKQERKRRVRSGLERRLVWKQDLLILPVLALIYFAAYLDRNSFGNGRLLGLQKEIGFSNEQYSNAAQYFFIGYTIFMFPGSIFLRYVRPNLQIGGAAIAFGTFLCGMSVAKTYATVVVMRVFIGAAQAFVQNSGVYNSLWYLRREVAFRGALIFSTATLSGAFSGLIAYAIGKTLNKENSGRSPWQWLFLIEGVIAIGIGLLTVFLLPQFPDKIKNGKHWLFKEEEVNVAIERSTTWNAEGARTDLSQVWACLKDPKSYCYAILNGATALCLSSVGVFLPTFIHDFGYTDVDAQLFSVIPYACAFVSLLALCYISDWFNIKGPFILLGFSVSAIGYIMLLTVKPTAAKMVAACFITSGMYPATVLMTAWLGINTCGFTKRASVWSLAEVSGQLFSIMGTHIYVTGPRYVKGHAVVLGIIALSLVVIVTLMITYSMLNKKRDRILAEYAARGEVHPHANRTLEEEHDFHINFRYTL